MPNLFHINRSRILSRLLVEKGWRSALLAERSDFSMWCEFDDVAIESRLTCFDFQVSRLLDDKLSMYNVLKPNKGEDAITPPVFESLPAYLQFLKQNESAFFCFLKSTIGAGGDDVYCFTGLKGLVGFLAKNQDINGKMVLQHGVQDVQLIDNKKFKIRTYVLVLNDWSAYIYNDSLIVLHESPYDQDSSDKKVQMSPDTGDDIRILNEQSEHSDLVEPITKSVRESIHRLQSCSTNIPNSGHYHLFGYDLIATSDGRSQIIEVNAFPNLERQDSIGKSVSIQMMKDLFSLVINPATSGHTPQPGGFVPL